VGATTAEAFSWIGRLDGLGTALGSDERLANNGAPVMIVIGEVVTLAGVLGAAASIGSADSEGADSDLDGNVDTVLRRRLEDGTGGR
jgi:hypothetical protein